MPDTKKIGAKIVLDGEAEFRQSINNSKSALKQFDSELKLTQTQFEGNEKSMEALRKVQQTYIKQQGTLQKQEKAYVDQLEKARKAHDEATEVYEKAGKRVADLKKELEDAKKEYGENSEQVKKLNSELEVAEREYTKQGTAIGNLENKMSKWETGLNETRTALVEVGQNLAEVNENIENFDESMTDAGEAVAKVNPEMNQLSLSMGKLITADLIADGIRRLASSVVDLAKSAIDVGMEFEASMSKVEALSGATGDELEALTEKAREMGATTMYSASEAADALSYMALAGWDTQQMLTGIEPVLNLAAAANMDLAETSDIVTDYLTAFGLEAQDASRFTDQLAYAMANSNTDVQMLGEAYKDCAAAAGSMGFSVEDVTAALMTMANAGVKGGEAGTSLRSIMINLATNTKGCADTLREFGVEVYDMSTGEMNSLSDILIQTASAFDGLTDAEANSLAKTIAGKTQFTGFETILLGLNEAAKESGMSFEDYAAALQNCDGYAKQMADTMQNNLQGKLTILDSALQALGESVYDVFSEDLKEGVDDATDAVSRLNDAVKKGDLNTSLKRISAAVNELIDGMADWSQKTLPEIIDGLANILENADKIIPTIKGITAAFVAFKGINEIMFLVEKIQTLSVALNSAAEMQTLLNTVSMANPYVLLATAFIGVAVALDQWAESSFKARTRLSETAQASADLASSADDLSESVRKSISSREEEMTTLTNSAELAHKLADELSKLQGEYKNGADNMAEMKSVVDQLNAIFPNLNLAINEQTGELNQSTDAINKNINALNKQAKAEAAREQSTEIAKEQVEVELKLAEIEEQIAEQVNKTREAYEAYNEDAQTHVDMNGQLVEVENEYTAALENERESLNELQESRNKLLEDQENLNNEYSRITEYVNENASATENLATAVENTTETIISRTPEWMEAYGEAYEAAQESLAGQSGLFTQLSMDVETTIGEMTTNLESQSTVFQTFAEDLKRASEMANYESDPNFRAIVASIEAMGVDGAGYLHEFLEAAEGDTEEFNALMEAWAEMSVAKTTLQDTMATFEADYTEGTNNLKELQQVFKEDTELTTQELTENVKQTVSTANEEINANVEESLTALEGAIVNATPIVQANSQELADAAKKTIEEEVNYDKFYHIGEEAGRGLAEGLQSQVGAVQAAAQALSDAASVSASASVTPAKAQSNSSADFGTLNDSMHEVVRAVNNSMNTGSIEPNKATATNETTTFDNDSLTRIDSMLTEYLPALASLKVVLETGKLVGELAPAMDKELGKLATRGNIR